MGNTALYIVKDQQKSLAGRLEKRETMKQGFPSIIQILGHAKNVCFLSVF
jgi:hypothetical protein